MDKDERGDVFLSETDEDESNPSTPCLPTLPNLASLADSGEIREFDHLANDSLTAIIEEGNENGNGNGNGNGKGNSKTSKTKSTSASDPIDIVVHKKRHFSNGQVEFVESRLDKRPSVVSMSGEDENTVLGFVQLDVLPEATAENASTQREWNEISRWIRYEQDIEEGSARLGRPHIAPTGHYFITKLNKMIDKYCIDFLDMDAKDLKSIAEGVVKELLKRGFMDVEEAEVLMKDLLLHHKLVVSEKEKVLFSARRSRSISQRRDSYRPSLGAADMPERRHSLQRKVVRRDSSSVDHSSVEAGSPVLDDYKVEICETPPRRDSKARRGTLSGIARFFSADELDFGDQQFSSGPPVFSPQAESTMIMVRNGYKRRNGVLILIRLESSILLSDVTQFQIPTRFIVIFLAPVGYEEIYTELGKTFGTLMSNRRFYKSAQSAKDTKSFLTAIREFLDESIVLPPGEWYNHSFYDLLPVHHLEMKCDLIRRQKRQILGLTRIGTSTADGFGFVPQESQEPSPEKDLIPGPFVRTKKPFGGLINDVKRRYPLYLSDILDGLNLQAVAATIFLYFAAIAHNVTFGGLLGQKTKGMIGVPETLIAASFAGIVFALFSGQPLNCIAPTGPLLVFDELLYKFMERHDIEFLPARVWIGFWVILIAIPVIAFEGSVLVKQITRFSMETFSALISVIFIVESMESLMHIYQDHPLTKTNFTSPDVHSGYPTPLAGVENATIALDEEYHPVGEPNTALLSTFLMFGTFIIAFKLKHLRTSNLFGSTIRNLLGDFGVPIGIMIMVSIDYICGDVYTKKIKVPDGLEPTSPDERGWVISPFGIKKPFDPWMPLITFPPGVLVFFLMFMTVEICEKIIYQNDALRKGVGLHLDPMILAITNFCCGLFGFPWVSVATLKALAHIAALTVYSKNNAPGIPPTVVQILENRVSALIMSIFIGLSVFMAPVLAIVPMCVLFGVFLYMGITSFMPTQLYERLLLLLTPTDSHPQTIYVRRVPTWKIHMYTSIQCLSLAALWAVKSVKEIALFFPIILMLLVPIRKSLKFLYSESELEALDGGQPAKPVPEKQGEKPE